MEHLAFLRADLYGYPLGGADLGETFRDRLGDSRFFGIARPGRAKLQSEGTQFADPTADSFRTRLAIKLYFAATVKPEQTKAVRSRRRLLRSAHRIDKDAVIVKSLVDLIPFDSSGQQRLSKRLILTARAWKDRKESAATTRDVVP